MKTCSATFCGVRSGPALFAYVPQHGLIQKYRREGGGVPGNVYLVINVFHRGSYEPPQRSKGGP